MPDLAQSFYDYRQAVLGARNTVMGNGGINQQTYTRLYDAIARAFADATRDFGEELITPGRFEQMRATFRRMLANIARQAATITGEGVGEAMDEAARSHTRAMRQLQQAAGTDFVVDFSTVKASALDTYIIRRGLPESYNYRTLINRAISHLQPQIDDIIQSGIARGISADRLTLELAKGMSDADPAFLNRLQQINPSRFNAYDIDALKLPGPIGRQAAPQDLKKLLYDARRIAVSEINSAYNEADRIASAKNPAIDRVKWEVSGRHYGLPSTPDACTMNYEVDQYGLGNGVFPVQTVPSLLHPHCGCYTYKLFRPPSKWSDPKPTPPLPALNAPRNVKQLFEGKTQNYIERQLNIVNESNRLAYQTWERFKQ